MNRVSFWIVPILIGVAPAFALAQSAPPATKTLPEAGGYASIALDPASSGISAVNSAADMFKNQDPQQGIAFFEALMPSTRNYAVLRMIRFQLIELYLRDHRQDMALQQLKELIISTPPTTPPSSQVIQLLPADASATPGGQQ
jgi:hypothetical protein